MKYVVFDIETTGLDPNKDRIVEIGAVKLDGEKWLEDFNLLINPGVRIPSEVTAINHITNEMVSYALPSQVALHQFQKFIEDADFLVGHNAAKFDYPFLLSEFERHQIHHRKLPLRDTLFLARRVLPFLKSYSLASLCRHFEVKNEDAHRALSDAKATGNIYVAMERVKKER